MNADNRQHNDWMQRARCALLVVVGVLVYANSLSGPFIFDDMEAIETNEHLRQLWPPSQSLTAPPQASVAGRPVVSLTLALNYAVGELDVAGYHAVNIAIHVLSALVLFGVVRRTLLGPALAGRYAQTGGWIAFLCALLWLVHPLQTEVVNYTTQRTESLMGLFYLLTLYGAIRAIGAESRRHRWIFAAVAFCALGMASKESMATAPLIVLLYDAAFGAGSIERALRERTSLYAGLAATWIVLIILNLSGPRSETVGLALGVGAWDYLLNQCLVVVHYLRLAVWPHPLTIDYGYPQPMQLGDVAPYAVALVALLGTTLVTWVRRPTLGFLGLWFFVILAPTSSFVPIVSEVGAERRMYLPLAGLVVLAVVLGESLIRRREMRRLSTEKAEQYAQQGGGRGAVRTGAVVALAAAVLLAGTSVRRNRDYRSEASIWQSAVQAVPYNHRAHYSLGEAMQSEGDLEAAAESYRTAIGIKPDYARAHHNLATILRSQGEPEEAIRHYRLAAESRPDYAITHFNLGNLLQAQGRPEEAIPSYRAAIEVEPDFIEAHNNLGILLQRAGSVDEALEHYRETLRIDPDYENAYYNIGGVLQSRGQLTEAIEAYRRAVAIRPDYARAHYMLALTLRAVGELEEAMTHMRLFEQYEFEGSQGPP